MTTRRTGAHVSALARASRATGGGVLVWMAVAGLAFGACARGPSSARGRLAPVEAGALAIRFDNGAREHVHVYLVGARREWLLGRVEAGARETLKVPVAAIDERHGLVQLAVIAGARRTLQAASDPRAMLTVEQPASHILSQRWMLAQGQLASTPLVGRQWTSGR